MTTKFNLKGEQHENDNLQNHGVYCDHNILATPRPVRPETGPVACRWLPGTSGEMKRAVDGDS